MSWKSGEGRKRNPRVTSRQGMWNLQPSVAIANIDVFSGLRQSTGTYASLAMMLVPLRISVVEDPIWLAVWNAWSGDCSVKPMRENLRCCGTPDLDCRTPGVSSSLGEINWVG